MSEERDRREKGEPLWRQHQSKEIMEVVAGLRDGELQPLADYLRAGGLSNSPSQTVAIPKWVADEIADMITGDDFTFFRFGPLKRRRKNGPSWASKLVLDERRWQIGYFTERRLREFPSGAYPGVIAEIMARFAVGKTTVDESLAYVRKYLAHTATMPDIDGWAILNERYSADYDL